jgi:hypothetical protein
VSKALARVAAGRVRHSTKQSRWWPAVLLAGILPIVFTARVGNTQPAPAAAQSLEQMSVAELQQFVATARAREQALLEEIRQERERVQWYLIFTDQFLQMQRFLGESGGSDSWQDLVATRRYLYDQSFGPQEWSTLLANHHGVAARYFQRVGQSAMSNAALQQQLQATWQQYEGKIGRGEDISTELLTANQILAWALGYPTIVPELDHFQGTRQRVEAAMVVVDQPPTLATSSARPLLIENRTRQIIYLWLYRPEDFSQPVLTFPLNPGWVELTNSDRSPLAITPDWGIAAQTTDQSLSWWPPRALKSYQYVVDQNGRYYLVLAEP